MNAREIIDLAHETYMADVSAYYDARSDTADDALVLPWPDPEPRYILEALRAAAGGADRVVLCWDGDECTLRGLEQTNVGKEMVRYTFAEDGSANAEFGLPADPLFRLTDVAVTSPEEDR